MVCKVHRMLCTEVRKSLRVWWGQQKSLLHSTCWSHKIWAESFVYTKKTPPQNPPEEKKKEKKKKGNYAKGRINLWSKMLKSPQRIEVEAFFARGKTEPGFLRAIQRILLLESVKHQNSKKCHEWAKEKRMYWTTREAEVLENCGRWDGFWILCYLLWRLMGTISMITPVFLLK